MALNPLLRKVEQNFQLYQLLKKWSKTLSTLSTFKKS
jgi:hypothetical protein